MKKKNKPSNLPPCYDNLFWDSRTPPLRDFLLEPRNWFELVTWAKSKKIGGYLLKNYLARLEDQNVAEAITVKVKSSGKYMWIWRLIPRSREDEGKLFSDYVRVDPREMYASEKKIVAPKEDPDDDEETDHA